MSHTPAPWIYNPKPQRVTAEDGEQLVADIRGWGRLQYKADGEKTQDANGYLVAAAPELLAALEEVVRISDRKHNAWDAAHVAIAKARGESV